MGAILSKNKGYHADQEQAKVSDWVEVGEFDDTDRGNGGFGSTGK
jgi:hypothetical protein